MKLAEALVERKAAQAKISELNERLQRVMDEWCPTFPGLHAYYPSHRNSSRALKLVIDAVRYKPDAGA